MLALQLNPPPVNGTPYELLVAALLWAGVIALVFLAGTAFDAFMHWGSRTCRRCRRSTTTCNREYI